MSSYGRNPFSLCLFLILAPRSALSSPPDTGKRLNHSPPTHPPAHPRFVSRVMKNYKKKKTLRWLLFAGETEGVLGADGACVSEISPETLPSIEASLGGSRGTDVTGGMASKVRHPFNRREHGAVRGGGRGEKVKLCISLSS